MFVRAPYSVSKSVRLLSNSGTRAKVESADDALTQLPKAHNVTLVSEVKCRVIVCACVCGYPSPSRSCCIYASLALITRSNKRKGPFFSLYMCVGVCMSCPHVCDYGWPQMSFMQTESLAMPEGV